MSRPPNARRPIRPTGAHSGQPFQPGSGCREKFHAPTGRNLCPCLLAVFWWLFGKIELQISRLLADSPEDRTRLPYRSPTLGVFVGISRTFQAKAYSR